MPKRKGSHWISTSIFFSVVLFLSFTGCIPPPEPPEYKLDIREGVISSPDTLFWVSVFVNVKGDSDENEWNRLLNVSCSDTSGFILNLPLYLPLENINELSDNCYLWHYDKNLKEIFEERSHKVYIGVSSSKLKIYRSFWTSTLVDMSTHPKDSIIIF